MIPWEQRRSWLTIGLAGLEMACLVPVLFALYRNPLGLDAMTLWIGLWAVQCLWILVVDWLSAAQSDAADGSQPGLSQSQVRSLIFAGILVSSVILVRVVLYSGIPLGRLTWVGPALRGLFFFESGISPELLLILTNILLWQRALQSGSSSLHFRSLVARIRWLWFFSLASAMYVSVTTHADPVRPVLAGFPIGLLCLVIGRSDEQATAVGSMGRPLRWWHLAEWAVIVLAVSGLGLLFAATPMGWLGTLLDTLFGLILLVIMQILLVLVFLVYPLVLRGIDFLMRRLEIVDVMPPGLQDPGVLLSEEIPAIRALTQLSPLALSLLRIGALLLVVVGAALLVSLVWRAARPSPRRRVHREKSRWAIPDGSFLRQGLARVQDALALVRQIGIGEQLLAATSVRNIYANLTRLATQRGYPRQKHQPPDRYLNEMIEAFAGFEQPLQRITAAYMRVHYGDYAIERAELEQIQSDYREIRKAAESQVLS